MLTSKQVFSAGLKLDGFTSGDDTTRGFTEEEIKSIQLDAYKAGMREAAGIL